MKKKIIFLLTVSFLCATSYSHAAEENNRDNSTFNEGTGEINSDLFGKKGGYIHPFFPIAGLYTDNVFNVKENTASDVATVLSPGVWLAVPGTRTQVVEINTSTRTPGGLDYDIGYSRYRKRFQSYLLVASAFSIYSEESKADTEEYWVEGFIQYNFPGNLSFDLINQYADSHDEWSARFPGELDKYKNNFFTLRTTYALSDMFRIRVDYANYYLEYDDQQRNSNSDRTDNSFSGYFFYNFRPKYSLFAQYDHINVKYDTNSLADNNTHRFYGGLNWEISAKSYGRLQAGYTNKEFDSSLREDQDATIFRAVIRHAFTAKTSLELRAFRQIRESYITTGLNDILTNEISAHYRQKITSKISANIDLSYTNEDYSAPPPGFTTTREDKFYHALPSVEYHFRKWLSTQFAYIYNKRDSNFSIFDYKNNTFLIRIKTSL